MNDKRLLLINGPPRAGKDTAGRLIAELYPGRVYVTKFAKALKERTHALYGLYSIEGGPLDHDTFEDSKDQPSELFMGITPRRAYIAVSEILIKPLHGGEVFGRLLLDDIRLHCADADLVVVTDSGFSVEAAPLMQEFGTHRSTLIRLARQGTSYCGDSRGRFLIPGVFTYDIANDGSETDLALRLSKVVSGLNLL